MVWCDCLKLELSAFLCQIVSGAQVTYALQLLFFTLYFERCKAGNSEDEIYGYIESNVLDAKRYCTNNLMRKRVRRIGAESDTLSLTLIFLTAILC